MGLRRSVRWRVGASRIGGRLGRGRRSSIVDSHQGLRISTVEPRLDAVSGPIQNTTENLTFLREEWSQDEVTPGVCLQRTGLRTFGPAINGLSDTETETGIRVRTEQLLDGLEAVMATCGPRRPDSGPAQN